MFPYYKRFDLQVTVAEETVTEDFEVDKDVKFLRGVLLTSNYDDLLYYRGQQSITINGKEFFPSDYESKLLMTGINTDPNTRYYDLGEEVISGKIRVSYTDIGNDNADFIPYRVSIYVKGERAEQ